MRQFITNEEWLTIPEYSRDNLIQIAGFSLMDKTNIHKKFTIGMILDLIGRRVEADFHVNKIDKIGRSWVVHAFAYSTEDNELLVALFKALSWCYDDEKRKKLRKEEEEKWKDNSMRSISRRYAV